MSLFGSIQLGANTLQAMQIGLQVTGNNIANADTPGYIRQETVYKPAPVQRIGGLVLGLGVQVDGIVQQIDKFVQDRLVGAKGDRAGADIQQKAYNEVETVLNGLSGTTDLSTSLTTFVNSIQGVLGGGDSPATRNLIVGNGQALTQNITNLASRVGSIRDEYNDRVASSAGEINNLADQIKKLNVQIATAEGGGSSSSQAGGLRVQRQTAINRLSEIVGIKVTEQPSGADNISVGGEFLVFEGQSRQVEVKKTSGNGALENTIQFSDTKSALAANSGELQGEYTARDQIAGNLLDGLNKFASTLAFEFNKVYSQGQGSVGFGKLTSVNSVTDADKPLDEAGLAFSPTNGTFQILVHNKNQDITQTHDITIAVNGLDNDTTLNSLAKQIDSIDGISASVTTGGKLQITSDSSDTEFAFSGDTSGTLASLGLNTFFTGSTAQDIGVNQELIGIGNEAKFAASGGGLGSNADTGNAEKLSQFLSTPLASADGSKLPDIYDQIINSVSQGATVAKSTASGYQTFEAQLNGQLQAVGGVSIDEEAIQLMTLQRIYQASARFIKTASDLLDVLVNI
jgi:flagellar hook-associated protein 1 FlgK